MATIEPGQEGFCTRSKCMCPTVKMQLANIATLLQLGADSSPEVIERAIEKLTALSRGREQIVCDRKL